MPGIEVNETSGQIKYMGKPVETVMLEGDDLFGRDYTIGTKNINVDAVQAVEAIENYTENDLLKGMVNSEKVALNLKLKENMVDLSGDFELGAGPLGDKLGRLVDGTILDIQKKLKSFAVLEHNNIGQSKSPRNYFSYSPSFQQLSNQRFTAEKIIPENSFTSLMGESNSRFNNEFFSSINALYKFNDKLSVKLNAYTIDDQLRNQKNKTTMYVLPDHSELNTSDNINFTKLPFYLKGKLEINYNIGEKSSLLLNTSISDEEIKTNRSVLQNGTTALESSLLSELLLHKTELQYTLRLNSNHALLIHSEYAFSKTPQQYQILTEPNQRISQFSKFEKTYFSPTVQWIGNKGQIHYTIGVGYNYEKNPFRSQLNNPSSENDLAYSLREGYSSANLKWELGKLEINPFVKIANLIQNRDSQNSIISTSDFLINPRINIRFRANSHSRFNVFAGSSKKPFSEQFIFGNIIQINERNLIVNEVDLNIQERKLFGVNYRYNNTANNFTLISGIQYNRNSGNYFPQQTITDSSIISNFIYLPNESSGTSANLSADKYIHTLSSRIKLGGYFSRQQYFNYINDSDLRKNNANILGVNLFYKSAFNSLLNFENSLQFNSFLSTTTANSRNFENQSLSNHFKVISYLRDDLRFYTDFTHYRPGLDIDNSYNFVNATLTYSPKDKQWRTGILFYNIMNETDYETINTSDISKLNNRTKLLPRRGLLSFSYSF